MNEAFKETILKHLNTTVKALERNQMEAHVVAGRTELLAALKALLPKGAVICAGGSMTLEETGVNKLLASPDYDFYSRGRVDKDGQPVDVYNKAFSADWYFTSSNAITMEGELYNVDGIGNRVAAIAYGPKHVIVVAGYNKVVRDLEDAAEHVRAFAAPANAQRLDRKTGCRATGYCVNCHTAERICCTAAIQGFQRDPDRIKVFLLPEELGY